MADVIETKVTVEEDKDTKKRNVKLDVVQCLPFEGDMKNNIMTNNKLCGIISNFFGSFMQDYYGCEIGIADGSDPIITNCVPANQLFVTLYFKDQGPSTDGRLKCLEMNGTKDEGNGKTGISDLAKRFCAYQQTYARGNMYHVHKDACTLLTEFMYTSNPNWNMIAKEVIVPMTANPSSKGEVVVSVTGLSLNAIITKIYGYRDENSTYDYRTNLASNVGNNYVTNKKNFLVQISQLDIAFVRELENELGFNNYTSSFYVWNRG